MRFQLIVAGFNRKLSVTLPSLKANVIRPLEILDPQLTKTAVVSRTRARVENLWSKERGWPEYEVPADFSEFQVDLIDQEDLDQTQSDLISHLVRVSNPPTLKDRQIVINLIRYLLVLRRANSCVDESADFILHVRPDLFWHEPLKLPQLHSGFPRYLPFEGMMTARWGGGGAPNDRFALLSHDAAGDYFLRLRLWESFLRDGPGFSAENLLSYAMKRHRVQPCIPTKASRVRLDGVVTQEKFGSTRMQHRSRLARFLPF